MDSRSKGLPTAKCDESCHDACRLSGEKSTDQCQSLGQMISIDMFPDEVLLAIFDFCAGEDLHTKKEIETWWQSLVHVCRRWRSVVFGSPRRLNVRLFCTPGTPRDTLDVWPPLPLIISAHDCPAEDLDNMIALLEQSDRVCQISLMGIPSSHYLERLLEAMQKPFPELTELMLWALVGTMPVLPDSFLGGSASRLRKIWLNRIPFPGLPKLLLSAAQIVALYLWNIPPSGYISPEAIATVLSTLTSLGSLHIRLKSSRPRSYPAIRHPPSSTRSTLAVLTELRFKGPSDYLEDLVARIDTPQLGSLNINIVNQNVFDTPHLVQFISCAPRLKVLESARVVFGFGDARFKLSSQRSDYLEVDVGILCRSDQQLLSLAQIFTLSLLPLPTLEDLYICEEQCSQVNWQDRIEIAAWLELLRPFPAVKNLYLSEQFVPRIAPALQELVNDRTTEVLPALENIFLEGLLSSGSIQEGIRRFVAARQVTSLPIAVARWER